MIEYLDGITIQAQRTSTPPRNRNVCGYGSKIPTQYELRIDRRWHRVYAICYSNASTYYVLVKGLCLLVHYYDIQEEGTT